MWHNVMRMGMAAAVAGVFGAMEASAIDVLLLTKSSGFEHSAITRDNDEPSLVERVADELSEEHEDYVSVTATKDASLINADNLANYDVAVFYTSGNLLEEGSDGHPPMTEEGKEEFLQWIEDGGGFIGIHSATDTFRGGDPDPYIEMLGGEFITHGPQFEGTVHVTDAGHPAMEAIPTEWDVWDEWYIHTHLNRDNIRVLAVMEAPEDIQEDHSDYEQEVPIMWCRSYGDGRVFYNAMGHAHDLWEDETFQQQLVDAVTWAAGEGPLHAEPNFHDVLPDY
ncbi:MAG: ThuA domain-containing protein [Candidatus Hydrogenedentota bacterium]